VEDGPGEIGGGLVIEGDRRPAGSFLIADQGAERAHADEEAFTLTAAWASQRDIVLRVCGVAERLGRFFNRLDECLRFEPGILQDARNPLEGLGVSGRVWVERAGARSEPEDARNLSDNLLQSRAGQFSSRLHGGFLRRDVVEWVEYGLT
jgi:hypothetical protein